MNIHFYKYQGTGNDFILLDNRDEKYSSLTRAQVQFLCQRHFGIGADGLMLLNKHADFDFEMQYYNSDGNESSMCGNGGRCIAAFAKRLGIIQTEARFAAIDGAHQADIAGHDFVKLKMNDVNEIHIHETYYRLNTGSPHYVHFTEYAAELDVKKEGALIRYSPLFKEEGINVNFAEIVDNHTLFVRTYERGVEDETLSCGTGVTASAIAFKCRETGSHHIHVKTPGGELQVFFTVESQKNIHSVLLCGKAEYVFEGDAVV